MTLRSLLIGAAAVSAVAVWGQGAQAGQAAAHLGVHVATAVSLPPASAFLAGSPLEIVVENVRASKGHVHVDVCSQDTFLNERDCIYSATAPAVAGVTTVIVPKVPAGRYAVQAYLDENDNGKVDRNPLGIPREEVGFSGNPLLIAGPPRWKSVSFDHGAEGGSIHLKLRTFP